MKKSKLLLLSGLLILVLAACTENTDKEPVKKEKEEQAAQGENKEKTEEIEANKASSGKSPVPQAKPEEKTAGKKQPEAKKDSGIGTKATKEKSHTSVKKDTAKETGKIQNGADAAASLKQQLTAKGEVNPSDILFEPLSDKPQKGDKGAYYEIQLVSKSIQKNGGSGTVGIYYVYEDGSYKAKY